MRAPKYRPLDKSELAKALGRKSGVRMGLNQTLRELEQAGEIARIRKNRYVLPAEADLVPASCRCTRPAMRFSSARRPGTSRHLHLRGEHRHRDERRSRGRANHPRRRLRARAKRNRTARKAASSGSWNARTTRSSARSSRRGIFSTSCRTIRGWCTTFTCSRRPKRVAARATKSSSDWRRGNRATSIPKARSSRCWDRARARRRHALDHPEVPSADGISEPMCWRKRERIPETVDSRNARRSRRSARAIHRHDRSG